MAASSWELTVAVCCNRRNVTAFGSDGRERCQVSFKSQEDFTRRTQAEVKELYVNVWFVPSVQ